MYATKKEGRHCENYYRDKTGERRRAKDMKKSRHYQTDLIFELSSAGGGAAVGTYVFRLRLPLTAAAEQYASRNGAKAGRHGKKVGTHIKLLG